MPRLGYDYSVGGRCVRKRSVRDRECHLIERQGPRVHSRTAFSRHFCLPKGVDSVNVCVKLGNDANVECLRKKSCGSDVEPSTMDK